MGNMKVLEDGTIVCTDGVIKETSYESYRSYMPQPRPTRAPRIETDWEWRDEVDYVPRHRRVAVPVEREGTRAGYLWWELREFYWLIAIGISLLVSIPIVVYLAPSWFDGIYTFTGSYSLPAWLSDIFCWVSEALRVISPWAMGFGGPIGAAAYGILRSVNGEPYRISDYVFSTLCALAGMIIIPLVLFLLAVILGLAVIVAIIAAIVGIIWLIIRCFA